MTLKQTLDQWAQKLATKAAQDATPLQESTDAFKAVTAYYAAKGKRARKQDEDEPDSGEFTFAGSDEVIHGSRGQKVRASRNS